MDSCFRRNDRRNVIRLTSIKDLEYYLLYMKIKTHYIYVSLTFFILTLFISCQETVTKSELEPTKIEENEDKIIITDQKQNKWDITAAVEIYEMEPHRFVAGLGPGFIPPITKPVFIGPDHSEYPDDSAEFIILAVNLRGIKHAYSHVAMPRHEVVDDIFLDQYVAVAY